MTAVEERLDWKRAYEPKDIWWLVESWKDVLSETIDMRSRSLKIHIRCIKYKT